MVAVRLYSLSNNPNRPCFVLKWADVCVMLDCALEIRTLLQFLPVNLIENERLNSLPPFRPNTSNQDDKLDLKECNGQPLVDGSIEVLPPESDFVDFSEIDAVLISNCWNMLALPYITESPGFKGIIYATEPTIQFSRLLINELVEYTEKVPKSNANQAWKNSNVIRHFHNLAEPTPTRWRPLYSAEDVESCFSKIRPVSFHETISLRNLLNVTPVSSGFSIGSCNWIMETDYEKFVYVSTSSVVSTHSQMLDVQALKDCDVLILSCLAQTSTTSHNNRDSTLDAFCNSVVSALKGGGNVLIPFYPTGLIYDLLEYLFQYLDPSTSVYMLSHAAENSLALANIYAEWLAEMKQAHVFIPEEPFSHGSLIKNGRLKVYRSACEGLSAEYTTPCVVFAAHPSLRVGDAVHFMEIWREEAKNVVILTEPDFCNPEVLSPYQPLAMKVRREREIACATFSEMNQLLDEIKPKCVYVAEAYNRKAWADQRDATIVHNRCLTYRKNFPLAIPIKRKNRKLSICPALAANIDLQKVDSKYSLAQLRGQLSMFGGKLELEQQTEPNIDSTIPSPYGQMELRQLLMNLYRAGFDPKSASDGSNQIRLEAENVTIETKSGETRVKFESIDEALRTKLRNVVLTSLCKL